MSVRFSRKIRNENPGLFAFSPVHDPRTWATYRKVPDDIHPALETCSSSEDGLPKASLHQGGPLADGIASKHESGYKFSL